MYQKFIPIAAFILWAVSLALPGIIFEPTLNDNPKFGFCSMATIDGAKCTQTRFGIPCTDASCYATSTSYHCTLKPIDQIANSMSQDDVSELCGQDWNEPRSKIMRGYQILLWGWLGVLVGNLAWWGNPFVLASMYLIRKGLYRGAFYCAFIAFWLGISAFSLSRVPRNEGGVDDFVVNSLGSGYSVWMIVIILLFVYTVIQLRRKFDNIADVWIVIGIVTTILIKTIAAPHAPRYFDSVYYKESAVAEKTTRRLAYEKKRQNYEIQGSDENLLIPFFRELKEGNYRVTIQESPATSYFEKGNLVRVGESTKNDPNSHYDIIKDGKVYTIHPTQKTFAVIDIKSDVGEALFKKMQSASIIGALQTESEFEGRIDWQYGENTQVLDDKKIKMELTFDPETKLLLSVYLKTEAEDGKLFHFKYQKISGEEMEDAKRFPLDYTKVDSSR